ncbi:hypothetical protein BVH74_13505 [Halopseudomonas phragmitis]|uniref:HTH tetR-type domain-containing protein n=3 Tax=Pseudomonadales TaxID=72274 RepID=A0A1V0B6Y3_9GAMM|nr:hypothetical protein BVH74_13505 [Halopseudomonas phragmitis]RHW22661.1 TetR/AcrR family transcriptional regulator [Pseudomonas jilinensis]
MDNNMAPASKLSGKRSSGNGPGRPVDPRKLDDILEAALESIAEGDPQFGMESVARRAGVAKGTLYRYFDNAEALLQAVLERHHQTMVGHLPEHNGSLDDLRTQLVALGEHLLDFLTSERGIKIMRSIIAHGARHGEHGRMIYRDGPWAFVLRAAQYLETAAARGQIQLDDPVESAEQLIGLWKGSLITGLMMNGCDVPDSAARRRRVERGVDLLLRAHSRS